MAVELTLIGRCTCHLCDDMARAVAPLLAASGAQLRRVDVDTDPALEVRYGEWVPVLFHGEHELCRYHLEPERVRAYLAEIS